MGANIRRIRAVTQLGRLCATVALIVYLLNLATASAAAPQTSYEVTPAAILIYANNPEDRAYDCSIWYVWSHESYRTTRTETVSETAHVAAKSNAVIHSQPLAYTYVQIEQGPKVECK
jgi:hypothetical protein